MCWQRFALSAHISLAKRLMKGENEMSKEKQTQKYSVVPYKIDENKFIEVAQAGDSVWLTQNQIAQLFDCSRENITLHLQNIFKSGELDKNLVCKKNLQNDNGTGFRPLKETLTTNYYNLDVIISVGYRVNSKKSIKFRQWATQVLKKRMQQEWAKRSGLNRIEDLNQRVAKIENLGSMAEFLAQHLYMPIKELTPILGCSPKTLYKKCQKNKVQYKKVKGNWGTRYEILLLSLEPALLQTIFGCFAQYLQTQVLSAPQEHTLITNAKELTADALQGDAAAYQKLNKILDGAAAIYNFEE